MNFFFHPKAEEEFIEAVAYYEDRRPGFGLDFSREVLTSIHNITAYPTMWPQIEGEIRRCLVHRFPYGVLYEVESNEVMILAVMHLHRAPGYWRHRRDGGEGP